MKYTGTYLITGGSGFLGKTLVKKLLDKGAKKVKVLARNEGNLIKLKMDYPQVEIISGNVSNPVALGHALKDVDGVFHLAAYKHVGLAERYTLECVNSNILGSLRLLEETRTMDNIKFIIGISTDKAAQVAGVYGATKYLMEELFNEYEYVNPSIKYRIVRYGNVLYSTGSVLCKWKKLLQEGKEIIITDENATRFYWTVHDALDLIFDCLENAKDSNPYVPDMKSMKLGDLLEVMCDKYSPEGIKPKIKKIGLQPGENLHELILHKFSNEVEQYTKEEIYPMI